MILPDKIIKDNRLAFVTSLTDASDVNAARLLIASIRAYGGEMANLPVLVMHNQPEGTSMDLGPKTYYIKAIPPEPLQEYPLGTKVHHCSMAEKVLAGECRSMVFLDPHSLILKVPLLFQLSDDVDAALRPFHLRIVGQPSSQPLTRYWKYVYQLIGFGTPEFRVTSFVDSCQILPYYNTHCFSLRPERGLCGIWEKKFLEAIMNKAFQEEDCREFQQRLFLHQVIFSSLAACTFGETKIRVLPPDYSYPYHLQDKIPEPSKIYSLNKLTHVVYEECSMHPANLKIIDVDEPLTSWLREYWLS